MNFAIKSALTSCSNTQVMQSFFKLFLVQQLVYNTHTYIDRQCVRETQLQKIGAVVWWNWWVLCIWALQGEIWDGGNTFWGRNKWTGGWGRRRASLRSEERREKMSVQFPCGSRWVWVHCFVAQISFFEGCQQSLVLSSFLFFLSRIVSVQFYR